MPKVVDVVDQPVIAAGGLADAVAISVLKTARIELIKNRYFSVVGASASTLAVVATWFAWRSEKGLEN